MAKEMKPRLLAWLLFGLALTAHAQDSNNILGLPAVPQVPPASAGPATASSTTKKAAPPVKPGDAEIKSALSGTLKLASFYQADLVTVRVATGKTFVGGPERAQALQAARLVQRDARLACGKLCKPSAMPAPTIQPDNTLSFDIVLSGYAGKMSSADMINLVSGKRLGSAPTP